MTLHAATYSGLVCTDNRPLKIDELLSACEADARILSQPVVDGMTPLNIACARRDQMVLEMAADMMAAAGDDMYRPISERYHHAMRRPLSGEHQTGSDIISEIA